MSWSAVALLNYCSRGKLSQPDTLLICSIYLVYSFSKRDIWITKVHMIQAVPAHHNAAEAECKNFLLQSEAISCVLQWIEFHSFTFLHLFTLSFRLLLFYPSYFCLQRKLELFRNGYHITYILLPISYFLHPLSYFLYPISYVLFPTSYFPHSLFPISYIHYLFHSYLLTWCPSAGLPIIFNTMPA